ncbi:MAG: ATP-binding cassette domain-containing protein, partial [Ferruginibacter sp.]
KEYLGFIAGLHKISGKQKRIEEMIGLTGLEREQHKKIGALSKGYRQRVGLAQALIHNPDVIILDEPTSGLDPNQLADIRELIRAIGKEKTLMFSTHIMQEVEAICDRVIIINRGKIVADGKADELSRQQKRGFTIEVEFDKAFDINILKKISGVKKVRTMKDFSFELVYEGEADIRPEIFKLAVEHQATVLTINRKELKLEEVFQQLTK